MKMHRLVLALAIAASPGVAWAQDPPQDPPAGGGRGNQPREPHIRPYDRVITKEAKSDDGVFSVHRIGDIQMRLRQRMENAFADVSTLARERGIPLRQAAYRLAVSRVAEATRLRGWVG